MKKEKSQVLLFLGSVGHFFFFFCLFFFFSNEGSGLILGSVGLRQYNNFFFALALEDTNGERQSYGKPPAPNF